MNIYILMRFDGNCYEPITAFADKDAADAALTCHVTEYIDAIPFIDGAKNEL